MYLDHHSLARIERILSQLKTQVMLLDTNGGVDYKTETNAEGVVTESKLVLYNAVTESQGSYLRIIPPKAIFLSR